MISVLTREDLEVIKDQRNYDISGFRTPYYIVDQDNFWELVKDSSRSRYFSVQDDNFQTIGYCGLYPISWENRAAEISLMVFEEWRGSGFGTDALKELIEYGFKSIGLRVLYGECYMNNHNAVNFWKKQAKLYNARECIIPDRKFWDGKMHDSYYFSISS